MPSGRKKNKWSARQDQRTPPPAFTFDTADDDRVRRDAQNRLAVEEVGAVAAAAATALSSSPTKWKQLERATSSLGDADADEEMGHSGGNHTNGVTSASPPPSHSSSSDGSAGHSALPPVAPLLSVAEALAASDAVASHRHARYRDTAASGDIGLVSANDADMMERDGTPLMTNDVADAAPDSPGEIFYVQLDPDSQLVTGVLPEMEQLHVQLTRLRRVLRQSGAVLSALRERARGAGDDVCELHATPSSQPNSQTRRRASHGSRLGGSAREDGTPPVSERTSARDSSRAAAVVARDRSGRSPRLGPHLRSGSILSASSPVGQAPAHGRRHGDDEETEWCDAATINTSASTTAQSTPSLQPTLLPPPPFHLFEEDELDDDGRGSHVSSIAGFRRTFVARFRPDSMPSSMQSTPNMLPACAPYARSDGGGVLCLPPSTSAVGRGELAALQRTPPLPHSPTAASPEGSVMSRLDNSPLLPPSGSAGRHFGQGDATTAPGTGQLTELEKTELVRLSQRVAELYRRRGVLLQRADRILCQHAQQHERWEGNEERRGCYRCRRLFSRLTRRHHCRRCGRLCCAECSRYVGKKQDTSYVAPVHATRGPGAAVAHRVIIKSEYTARMTADDAHVLAEESFDEHTYPRHRAGAVSVASSPEPGVADVEDPHAVLDDDEQQLRDASFAELAPSPENRAGRSWQHKWVRLCAPCYQNCLRARRNNVLQYLKNANLCILDDGFYYYHVMTKEELCQLSTALSKPDSFKKQVELMSHVVMERSVDYVAAAPAYSAQTLATAMHHTPDVLRTLGGISAYAFRSARQTANDYVGNYFASSRTILPDNPVGAATLPSHATADHDADGGDDECSEASVESLDDTCSDTQSPVSPSVGQHDAEARTTVFEEKVDGGDDVVPLRDAPPEGLEGLFSDELES